MDIRTFFLEVLSKASHEKSADAVVPRCDLAREGQNFKKRVVNERYQMRGRKRKTQVDTRAYQQNYRTASESYAVGQTFMGITENNLTSYDQKEYGLLEMILFPSNLNKAQTGKN